MKKLFYLFLILPFLFVACSDDDDNGDGGNGGQEVVLKPSEVLTGGLPKSVTGMTMTYNADGWLTSMTGHGEKVTFTYGDNVKTKAALKYPSDVIMKYEDGYEDYTIYMALGSNGFVSNCVQVFEDSKDQDIEYWSFKYNSDGQIVEMKRTEGAEKGETETTTITYSNGNIVKVGMVSPEETTGAEISYTSDTHKEGIVNKGCIMMFDEVFSIDLDEMYYAYYAGILGKATKQLPLSFVDNDYKEAVVTFDWTLNEQGLPTQMVEREVGELYTETYEFKW